MPQVFDGGRESPLKVSGFGDPAGDDADDTTA
jgi:hypothetical protein